jgi:hypothetical protein
MRCTIDQTWLMVYVLSLIHVDESWGCVVFRVKVGLVSSGCGQSLYIFDKTDETDESARVQII